MRIDGVADQPAVADVLAAVYRLDPPAPLRAVVHLSTPLDAVVGLHVRVADGMLRWRGEAVRLPGGDLSAAAVVVAGLVARGRVPGDRFVALGAAPWAWLKPVRSGASVHMFGASELFGHQHVMVDPALGELVVEQVGHLLADHALVPGPGELAGARVRVDVAGHLTSVLPG